MSLFRNTLVCTTLVVTSLACAGFGPSEEQEREHLEALAREASAASEAAPDGHDDATTASPPKWTSDGAIAAAIGSRHYMPHLLDGKPYQVPHPDGGVLELGAPQVVLADNGRPRAYPTGERTGHAIAQAATTDGQQQVLLDYTLVWNTSETTMSGDRGVFEVIGFEVLSLGEGERFTYTRSGDFFTRKAN